jgi:hypothetical protein
MAGDESEVGACSPETWFALGCRAEPQVSERINANERKADTMKTYLLKTAPVSSRKPAPKTAHRGSPNPVRPRPDRRDVHNDSIAVSWHSPTPPRCVATASSMARDEARTVSALRVLILSLSFRTESASLHPRKDFEIKERDNSSDYCIS